jgi:predicted DNA-binding transcriptional regulator AlpA
LASVTNRNDCKWERHVSAYLAPDAEQIKKAIATLHRAGSVIELRAIQKGGHKRVAAGHDPAIVPDMPFRFLTQRDVRELLGLSTASIYRGMAAGKIPRPIIIDGITTRRAVSEPERD